MPQHKERMDCFASLAMTVDIVSRSRDADRPSFASSFALFENRAQGRPGACCTRGLACDLRKQNCTRAYRAAGAFRPSLRNGFTAYFVLSPENGSFASVAPEKLSLLLDLAPAPRRPNHTTSPYASGAHVCRAVCVHRISPRVRDDRERPSSAVRRAELCR
jgi:hypothetical protein